jgi:mannose-6-phosphate isomerase-like protein (cupin superfamily)
MIPDFERRVAVEQRLLDAYTGKAPLPTREECRELAHRLGIPDEYRAPTPAALPSSPPSPTRAQVERLQREMARYPQAQLETKHFFANGMYLRKLPRPKDTLIVGKVHRHEHFYFVMYGRLRVTTDDGVRELGPGEVIVSKPGTKRAVLALEDSCACTVHRVSSYDLDEIEAEIIEPEEGALFDARNELKQLPHERTEP